MKNWVSAFLCASTCALTVVPAYSQDGSGFNGSYQQSAPQQFQPIAPQQGYGQITQQPGSDFPEYQPNPGQQQQFNQQAPTQGGNGSDPTFYGYAGLAQPQGQPQGQPQSYGQPPYQQQPYYPPQGQMQQPQMQQPMQQQPMQQQQTNLEQQAQNYFQQMDQSGSNSSSNDGGAQEGGTAQESAATSGLKKAGKLLVGVGSAMAGAYVMNKMINNQNPMQRMQNQMMRQYRMGMPYGMGMGMPGMGYGMPGMGYGMPGMGYGMPGMGGYGMNPFGY